MKKSAYVLIIKPSDSERFWSKVDKSEPDGCWPWLASAGHLGYGRFSMRTTKGKRPAVAPRVAYELTYGTPDPLLTIDHLCKNPRCVNPAHMELVPLAENIRRASNPNRQKTHCPKGHPYDGRRNTAGSRYCILCMRKDPAPARTTCRHGHPWVAENLMVSKRTGRQYCRLCQRDRSADFRVRHKPPR